MNYLSVKPLVLSSTLSHIWDRLNFSYMQKLDKIDEYKSFTLWLITVITICFTLYYKVQKMSPKEYSTIEMVPIACGPKSSLNARIQKALGDKSINPRAYEKYKKKYRQASLNML